MREYYRLWENMTDYVRLWHIIPYNISFTCILKSDLHKTFKGNKIFVTHMWPNGSPFFKLTQFYLIKFSNVPHFLGHSFFIHFHQVTLYDSYYSYYMIHIIHIIWFILFILYYSYYMIHIIYIIWFILFSTPHTHPSILLLYPI